MLISSFHGVIIYIKPPLSVFKVHGLDKTPLLCSIAAIPIAQVRRKRMFDPMQAYGQGQGSGRIADKNERYMSSESLSFKEDSDEIDALLSVEEEEDEEEEDDVMSTGRTPSNNSCNSPDSACSKYGKQRYGGDEKGKAGTATGDRKKERVKKMVKVLRGIVPGGRQMDTPAFLDEAVKYLKSLKMEAKKLGIQNSNNLN